MPPARERSRPRSISVVIPAYNAAATLAEQLEALSAQRYDGDWEVVIADNGSTDGTAELASRFRPRFKALVLVDAGPRHGRSGPRNAGANAARGELLVFCDADDVVAPGWLEAMADVARHYDLVGGWLDVRPLNDECTQSWYRPWPRDRLRSWVLPHATTANLGIWADVFHDLDGFSTHYNYGEDTELSWRAQLAGYRLGFAHDAVVYYRYRSGLRQVARQSYTIGVNCERLRRDFAFLRDGNAADWHDDDPIPDRAPGAGKSATGRAVGRAVWLATRLPYLVGSRRHRGQWINVAAEYLGRIRGAIRYRVVDRVRR
jgi:glycosyltransferase involved in cell wall biosynthesis